MGASVAAEFVGALRLSVQTRPATIRIGRTAVLATSTTIPGNASMGILHAIKTILQPMSYPQSEFGMDHMQFFLALLRACPSGSRLSFDRSEPESFVHAFREWSLRDDPRIFEADNYAIDDGFIASVQRQIAAGTLQLDNHFGIVAPDGRLLCSSLDGFTVVTLAEDIRQNIANAAARAQ